MYVVAHNPAKRRAPRARGLRGLGSPSFDCSFRSGLDWWNSLAPEQVWGTADDMVIGWYNACSTPGTKTAATPAPPPASAPAACSSIADLLWNMATGRLTQCQIQQKVDECISGGLRAGGKLADVQAGCQTVRTVAGPPADNPSNPPNSNTPLLVLAAVAGGAALIGLLD